MRCRILFFLIVLLGGTVLFYACQHQVLTQPTPPPSNTGGNGNGNPPPPPPPPPPPVVPPPATGNCSPDTVYFTQILPIIVSNCAKSGCHDATSKVDGYNLTTYAAISKMTTPGNGSGSKLYTVIQKGSMPPRSSGAVSAAQLTLIQTWINQGSKNNSCSAGCDTTQFTFSGTINPILQTYCVGCHNATTTSGSVNLSTYAGVQTVAANGQLVGSLEGTLPAPYGLMPLGGSALPACQITQFKKWVAAGAPNN